MTATTWARSDAYGSTVILGPTQAIVYRFVMGATDGRRRPTFTLREISERTGKPVSSVHDALGRLRALGLIGFSASMGRTGGHRLWRVVSKVSGTLDAVRRSRAIARIWKRWNAISVQHSIHAVEAMSEPLFADDQEPPPTGGGRSFGDLVRQYGRLPWDAPEDDPHASPTPDRHTTGRNASPQSADTYGDSRPVDATAYDPGEPRPMGSMGTAGGR